MNKPKLQHYGNNLLKIVDFEFLWLFDDFEHKNGSCKQHVLPVIENSYIYRPN